jgi:uncharacterized protein YndB with AHSA1/START domain
MDLTGEGVIPAPPDAVFAMVSDLSTYPQWLGIVLGVAPGRAGPDDDAWLVDLGARLGPLRKTKRVRMVRVTWAPPIGVVVFERKELDGREHSPWRLAAEVGEVGAEVGAGSGAGSHLTMHLHYGGNRWFPGLDLVLREEVKRAVGRLSKLVVM